MGDEDDGERLVNPEIIPQYPSKHGIKKGKIHSAKGKRDNAIQGFYPQDNRVDFQGPTTVQLCLNVP